jgi:DNA-directed RNA polymerases I, II, and III subunit RPABC1
MLSKVFKTLCEMLADRGLVSTVEAFQRQWGEEIAAAENTAQIFKLEHENKVRVVFYMNSKLQKTQDFINKSLLSDGPFDLVIVIFCGREKINSANIKLIEDHSSSETRIQVFEARALEFNISHHELVPKHEVVNNNDVPAILQMFNAKKKDMPNILHTDPMAKYLDVRPGELVRITRPSPTAGEYVFYRMCT